MHYYVVTRITPPCYVTEQYVVPHHVPLHTYQHLHMPQETHISRLQGALGPIIVTFRDPRGVVTTRSYTRQAWALRYVLHTAQEHNLIQIADDLLIGSGNGHPTFITFRKSNLLES